jgi:hypothetical protein
VSRRSGEGSAESAYLATETAICLEALVGTFDCTRAWLSLTIDDHRPLAEYAVAKAVGVHLAAVRRGEDEGGLLGVLVASPQRERLIHERAADLHTAPTRIGLRAVHVKPASGEINIAPAERTQLADSQAGVNQCGDDCPTPDMVASTRGIPIQLTGRIRGASRASRPHRKPSGLSNSDARCDTKNSASECSSWA